MRPAPLPVEAWAPGLLERSQAIVGGELRATANVYRTLANAPRLLEAWLHLGGHLLRRSTLEPRGRELVILRTTAVSEGTYPFAQHTRIGLDVGLAEAEIEAVLVGPKATMWSAVDRAVLLAVDELLTRGSLSDGVWADLAVEFSIEQRLDLLATTAFYRLASWTLNACGTPLDDGQTSRLRSVEVDLAPAVPPAPVVRLPPRPLDEWPADFVAETAGWPRFAKRPEVRGARVYGTLANHVELFRAIGPLMTHFLVDNSLDDRSRELVIVRSCYRDRGEYPYRQHVRIGAEAGLDQQTLDALASEHPQLDDQNDAALVRAVDELHDHNTITDRTWTALSSRLTTTQILDAVAIAGFYGLISFVLNSAGTELEAGTVRLPDHARLPSHARPLDHPRSEASP